MLTVSMRRFCCGSFLLFMFRVYLCYDAMSVPCNLVITFLEKADHLALSCVVFSCIFVTYPYGVLGQVWYLIVSNPDLCNPLNFLNRSQNVFGKGQILC